MRWKRLRVAFVATLGLLAGGALGCAEEREPINRVQPNALAKSFFVGDDLRDDADDPEFWTQGTVVDVGYGAAQDGLFTSTYAQPVGRIKWQITEDLLIGRLTYERIEDTDGKKGVGKSTDQGVDRRRVPHHVALRHSSRVQPDDGRGARTSSSRTASDRPWYEREYFRVDWSQNLNVDSYDFDTLSMLGIYGGVEYEPLAYYVNDPTDPDAPHFDPETGYFDVTNKAFATPQMIDLSHLGWGIDKFPACMLDNDFFGGSAPSGNCNPVELTIRQSFRRVVDKDYEPLDWDGKRFQAYGAFYVERSGYARNYGMSDDKWYRFINRYNIWDRSHYYGSDWHAPNKYVKSEVMSDPIECFVPGKTAPNDDPHRDARRQRHRGRVRRGHGEDGRRGLALRHVQAEVHAAAPRARAHAAGLVLHEQVRRDVLRRHGLGDARVGRRDARGRHGEPQRRVQGDRRRRLRRGVSHLPRPDGRQLGPHPARARRRRLPQGQGVRGRGRVRARSRTSSAASARTIRA